MAIGLELALRSFSAPDMGLVSEEAPMTEPRTSTTVHRSYIPPTHLDVLAPASRRMPGHSEAVAQLIEALKIPEAPVIEELIGLGIPQSDMRSELVGAIHLDIVQDCDCHDEQSIVRLATKVRSKKWPHLTAAVWLLCREVGREVLLDYYDAICKVLAEKKVALPIFERSKPKPQPKATAREKFIDFRRRFPAR